MTKTTFLAAHSSSKWRSRLGHWMRDRLREAFEDHYPTVVRLAVLISGRHDVAEDLAQEAFIRAADEIGKLDGDHVFPYLRRTVVNLWTDRLRRLAVERRHRLRLSADRPGPVHQPNLEERDALWAAVARLPSRQRACLVLRYYEDLSEAAVAEILGCSIGTVKSQTARARAHLRRELRDES